MTHLADIGKRGVPKMAFLAIAVFAALAIAALGATGASSHDSAYADTSKDLSAGTLKTQSEPASTETEPGIFYRAKLANGTWQGWKSNGKTAGSTAKKKQLESLQFELTGDLGGSVQYQIHVAGAGWMAAQSDNAAASAMDNRAIDAIRIALTGELSKTYDVSYQTNTQKTKWQDWKQNGSVSGATNSGNAIRAIRVKLVKKATPAISEKMGIIGVRYRENAQKGGWSAWGSNYSIAGNVRAHERLTNLQISLDAGAYGGSVMYRARLKSGKWTAWKRDGAGLGTSKKYEAFQVKLTGGIASKYDVVYRAYVQDVGWQRRMRNGETAGTTNRELQIEAIRVKLVDKKKASGWIRSSQDPETWFYYKSGKKLKSTWLMSSESPVDEVQSGKQRYWIGADGNVARGRYVNPAKIANDAQAGYVAFATWSGRIERGKFTNQDGLLLASDTGKLYTKTRWLTTSAFDGKKQRYRLVSNGTVAVVKTGLFKVNGKKYYAWEDGRGYLLRSTIWWVSGSWHKANSKGVLKKYSGKTTQLIDRYVKWAVAIANDNSHGYSQYNRWGPDYDCSSLVCASLKAVGFPDSGASWTGNMKTCLKKIGFKWHKGTSGLRRGDILLAHNSQNQHTEIYLGGGKNVGAHSSENGTISGKAGDQTGREISVTNYYNMPWDGYLRYEG